MIQINIIYLPYMPAKNVGYIVVSIHLTAYCTLHADHDPN